MILGTETTLCMSSALLSRTDAADIVDKTERNDNFTVAGHPAFVHAAHALL